MRKYLRSNGKEDRNRRNSRPLPDMGNFLNPLPLPIAQYIKAPPACEQSIQTQS